MMKFRHLVFALSVAAAMLFAPASQAQISVALPEVAGTIGSTIEVPIEVGILDGQNVTSFEADITFDPAVIDIAGFDASGTLATQFSIVSNTINGNTTFRIGGYTSTGEPATGSGTFVHLQVEIVGPGESPLTFSNFRFNEGSPAASTSDGSVEKANAAPEFTSSPPQSVQKNGTYSYSITTTDADGDIPALFLHLGPSWLDLTDNGDGTGVLTGSPTSADVGDHQVVIRALDGAGGTTGQSFEVAVESPNQAPVASNDSVTVDEDTSVDIDVLANDDDPDGDALNIKSVSDPERLEEATPGTLTFLPEPDSSGVYELSYTVEDAAGATATAHVVVSVLPVNDAPQFEADEVFITPAPGATITIGSSGDDAPPSPDAPLTVEWNAAFDAEGDQIDYTWQLAMAADEFETPAISQDAGSSTQLVATIGSLLDELREQGIAAGTTTTLYHRLVATDGEDDAASEPASLTVHVGTATSVGTADLPGRFELSPSFPNPFNPATRIEYAIPEPVHVTLKVYDTLGKEVATLEDAPKAPGRYSVRFEGSGLASGIYIYRIEAGSFSSIRQTVLLK